LDAFRANGRFSVEASHIAKAREIFSGARFDDTETKAMIRTIHDETGMIIDPHTAVGVAAARAQHNGGGPIVALATAHPGKFPDAITDAIGSPQEPPPALAEMMQRREQFEVLENDSATVQAHIAGVIEGARK
jgi:threonine synthase